MVIAGKTNVLYVEKKQRRTREGSNLRPTDPQSVALSTELRVQKHRPRSHPTGYVPGFILVSLLVLTPEYVAVRPQQVMQVFYQTEEYLSTTPHRLR